MKRRMIAVFLLLAILAGLTVSVYAAETTKTATATTTEIKDGWVYVYQTTTTYTYDENGKLLSTEVGEPVEVDRYAIEAASFRDIPSKAWYYSDVDFVLKNGMMNGTGIRAFSPDEPVSRAMVVTVLWRLHGSEEPKSSGTFKDVPAGEWYTKAVEWMAERGIVSGVGNGKFDPESPITREQMATILYNFSDYCAYPRHERSSIAYDYTDGLKVSRFAYIPMQWWVGNKILNGTSSTTLSPFATTTRAQLAAILHRFYIWKDEEYCDHNYSAWKTKTVDGKHVEYCDAVAPTETKDGYANFACKTCGKEYRDILPAGKYEITYEDCLWIQERGNYYILSRGHQLSYYSMNYDTELFTMDFRTKEDALEYLKDEMDGGWSIGELYGNCQDCYVKFCRTDWGDFHIYVTYGYVPPEFYEDPSPYKP